MGLQPFADHVDRAPKVGADAVHLVDEAHARDRIAIRLPPHRLRLRLDAVDGIEDHDATIEYAQAALDLDREVDVAGRIDNVDAMVVPGAGRCRGGDRDATFALLGHPVHDRRALVYLANLVRAAGMEQHPLCDRGLASVNVGDDADVAYPFYRVFSRH